MVIKQTSNGFWTGGSPCHQSAFKSPLESIIYTHTGQSGWGIAWYINGILVPEIIVERGRKYTFIIEGGDDSSDSANYHPFYITNSSSGGRLLNTQEQRQVQYQQLAVQLLSECLLVFVYFCFVFVFLVCFSIRVLPSKTL